MRNPFKVKALIAFLCVMVVSECSATTISVVGPTTSPAIGNTFTVDVDATGITDLYAFQFDLVFNPALLSAVSVTEGAFLPTGGSTFFIPGTIDNVGGSVTATADTLIGAIPGVTGDGILAAFQFTALAPGTSALTLQNLTLLDSTLSNITATTENGSVTIGGVSAVPEPSTLLMMLCVAALSLMGLGAKAVPAWRRR